MRTHPEARGTLSRRKKILFSLAPAALLAVLLILTEAGLRLFAPSLASPLVFEEIRDSTTWYRVNRRYLERYFPANVVLLPELNPVSFRKTKTERIFRVFCLGESSMFGTPYQMTATIPSIVRKQLRHAIPEKNVEVINLGASAINSNVIADIAPQLLPFTPDLVLIYMGHNEFYGPDGVGASWIERAFPSLTPWKYAIRDVRIVRLLDNYLARLTAEKEALGDRNMMREVSHGATVLLHSETADRIFSNFRRNLESILATFQKAGVNVIVSDISSNLLFPPFESPPSEALAQAESLYASGDFAGCLRMLSRPGDTTNARLRFWRGKALLAEGDTVAARQEFIRAQDEDLLKFRAPSRINQIIRDVTSSRGILCLSADSVLSANSPGGITGDGLFWEHLHPRAKGYFLIADLFFTGALASRMLPVADSSRVFRNRLPYQRDSLGICWLDLAYGDVSIAGLTSRWPFIDLHPTLEVFPDASPPLRKIVLDVHARKILWDEGCYRSAGYFESHGQTRDAETTYDALIEDNPFNFYPHYRRGLLLKESGRAGEAEASYLRSIALNPDYPYSLTDVGLLEINAGEFDAAITHLRAAQRLTRESKNPAMRATVYYGLSAAYANKGDFQAALSLADTSVSLLPGYGPARAIRQSLLRQLR